MSKIDRNFKELKGCYKEKKGSERMNTQISNINGRREWDQINWNSRNDSNRFKELFSSLDVTSQTIKDYKYRLPLFLEFTKNEVWDREILLRYKRFLADQSKYSVSTKNKYLATAKIFIKQLFIKGLIPNDISQTVKSFPQIKKHKKVGFTENEVHKITDYLRGLDNSKYNIRKKALVALMLFQGLRQIEIVRMKVEDLNLEIGTAMIQGKGEVDKEMIYLHPETAKILKELLKVWKLSSGYVFIGARGNSISTMTIKREIRVVVAPLGIYKSPHGFRHYFITKLLQKFDVREVRKFSRHKSLEMLIVYDDENITRSSAFEIFKVLDTTIFKEHITIL